MKKKFQANAKSAGEFLTRLPIQLCENGRDNGDWVKTKSHQQI